MGRIADLASGWTVESDPLPDPDPPVAQEPSAPRPRRAAKTLPPPPPGSAERKELEDKIVELTEDEADEADEADEVDKADEASARPATGAAPPVPTAPPALAAEPAPPPDGAPADLSAGGPPERIADNRGSAGVKRERHDERASDGGLTTSAASDTLGRDPPPPVFDRAALLADPKGARAAERVISAYRTGRTPKPVAVPHGPAAPRPSSTGASVAARGTPHPPMGERAGYPAEATPDPEDASQVAPAPVPRSPIQRLAVPLGEFDRGDLIEQDKLRAAYSHATIKRDPQLAGDPRSATPRPGPAPLLRGDPRFNDASGSSTTRFERDDAIDGELERLAAAPLRVTVTRDAPGDDRNDATTLSPPSTLQAPAGGLLRNPAALPCRSGLAGDLRYPVTVALGLRRANRELAALEATQQTRQQSRRHHQVTLGRTAVALADALAGGPRRDAEYPALRELRAPLAAVEEEREQHASEVAAADTELGEVRSDREQFIKQCAADLAAVDVELMALAGKLAPLERDAIRIKKRARKLHEALGRIDAKIAAAETSLTQSPPGKLDPAQVQAEIATLRAERKAVQSDEPAIAGELDALNPQIAALEAARGEAQRKRLEIAAAEREEHQRIEEVLVAIGARRKVVDRATAAAEAQRDKLLFQLGERLCVDRPADLTSQLAPIDEIDVELGSADRRIMELREVLSSVDRGKLARGLALLVAILGGLGALAAWLLPRFVVH